MADAFHLNGDQSGGDGVLPVPEHPFDPAPQPTPAPQNSNDPDWSHIPEALSTSKGPDGTPPSGPSLWSQHTGPQTDLKPDGTDITGSVAGVPETPEPTAERPENVGAPQPAKPFNWTDQVVNPAVSGFKQAWENDNLLQGLQNAQGDEIGNIVAGAKAKLGVTLEDPLHGGYQDEAIQRVIAQEKAQSWGQFFNPMNPESFFGGGKGFTDAVQKAQLQIFDEKRQALAEKIQGDNAPDRAGANADALALIDAGTPSSALGAKLSHQANVGAGQAMDTAGNTWTASAAQLVGGVVGGVRDPLNDLALITGQGLEPALASKYFPLAAKGVRIASDTIEAGARQALMNMGLMAVAEPEHQAANVARGEESGLQPVLHDLEDAGLSGFLPGSLIHGIKALWNLHGPDSKAWIDDFLRQAKASAPDAPAPETPMSRQHKAWMAAVNQWERENGHEEGWTYSDIGRNRPGGPPPPRGSGAPPPQPPEPSAGVTGEAPQLTGPRALLEGPKPFPAPPTVPDSARYLPSPSSIRGEDVASAEADHAAMPPMLPGTPPNEHIRAYTEAVQHAEAPDVMAPHEPPMNAAPARDANFLPPDHLPELAKAPAAGAGVVQRITGYEGPHDDLVRNRIAHLQERAEDPNTPPRVASEFARRARDFSRYADARDEALQTENVPADRAAAIRSMQPGDVITGKNREGDEVTGEISGWGNRGEVGISDHEDIHHTIPAATITKVIKGARGGTVNNVPHMAGGEEFAHEGKAVTNGVTFPARSLRTDAAAYQYKAGGDASGVTDRLQTVKKWSPLSVGNVVVHERLDGTRYIVDGHQRLGLANRIMAGDPSQNISLPGFLFKEKDGWTNGDVRAEAAAKNIREGLGDTLDIARILRDKPELWDDSLPIGRGDMKEARGLANLSEEAWGMALNGKPRTDFASFVGNMAEDRSTHLAIMDDLVKFDPRTQNEARMIIADAMQAGFNKTSQEDLFGTHEVTESLRGERSKVYAAAERLLQSDKKIFGMLNDEAPRIIAAGNILADTNAERADRAGQLAQGLITLARRAGPISSALNRAAQRIADGEAPKTAARTFLNELPALLKEEGLRVAEVSAPAKYDLDKPKGVEEQVRDLDAEFMATQPGMFGEPERTIDDQRAAIHDDVMQKLMDAGMPQNEADANGSIVAARYATRAARKGRLDPEQLYREAGISIRGDAQRAARAAGEAPDGRVLNQAVTVPTFYSSVERAVTNAKQAKASPDQWLAMVKNMPGVKPEEMKWLGLEDWLKGQKGTITRDAVADYVRANSLQLQEVTKSDQENRAHIARLQAATDLYDRIRAARTAAYEYSLKPDADENLATERVNRTAAMIRGLEGELRRLEALNITPPQYAAYKLPGGENYHELLLTLPEKDRITRRAVQAPAGWGDVDGGNIGHEETGNTGADYRSSHWKEPNVLAHIRYEDRTVDGKRALHLVEVQSDWHQAGRREGYKPAGEDAVVDREMQDLYAESRAIEESDLSDAEVNAHPRMREINDRISELHRNLQAGRQRVPDAPFKTNWPELSMKRMIRHAAENGYDVLSWDTGETNADRYGLASNIDRIDLHDNTSGGIGLASMEGPFTGGVVTAYDKEGRRIFEKYVHGEAGLVEQVGKEGADKVLAAPAGQVSVAGMNSRGRSARGLNLRIGGEGMVGFYDKILPTMVAKLTKKFGGKIGEGATTTEDDVLPFVVRNQHGVNVRSFFNEEQAARMAQRLGGTYEKMESTTTAAKVHTLAITPELRDAAVNEGFPLFQGAPKGAEEPRGRITMRDNGAVIDLFKQRNASTFQHEAAHLWLNELAEDAAEGDAPVQTKADLKEVLDWLGAKDAESITDKQHEKWARGFEQYLRDGKAPSSALARAFTQFKEWLKAIYRSLVGLGKEIPESIRAVMDRMIATDEEIAAARATSEKVATPERAQNESATPTVPTLEETQAKWTAANDAVRRGSTRALAELDTDGVRKQFQAQFHDGFEAAVRGEGKGPGKWRGAGHDAGGAFMATPEGEAAAAAVRGAHDTEDAYEAGRGEANKAIDEAVAAARASDDPLDKELGQFLEEDIKPIVEAASEQMVRVYHGGYKDTVDYAPWVASKPEYARDYGQGGRKVFYADIPLSRVPEGIREQYELNGIAPSNFQVDQDLAGSFRPLPATEAGPEGAEQTLMPGVSPVTGAERAAVGAAAPLRGGNAEPPEGGLFDEVRRAQKDFFDMTPTEDGLKTREQIQTQVPKETALGKLVGECDAF